MIRTAFLVLLASSAATTPAMAQSDPLAPINQPERIVVQPAPAPTPAPAPLTVPLTPPAPAPLVIVRPIPKDWRGVFDAIQAEDWAGASAGIATLPDGLLKPVAKAELFTARNSPRTDLAPILALLAEAPDLPAAEQLQRMAMIRGAIEPPAIVTPRPTIGLPMSPRRGRVRPIAGEPAADALRLALDPLIKLDDAAGAEALLLAQGGLLSIEARAEAAQRVAFIYYVLGRDADAHRVAEQWRVGARGDWAAQAAWISGLAAWRMNDYAGAQAAFTDSMRFGVGAGAEFSACAAYWASRAALAGHRPRDVQPLLLAAARSPESFYGLLARETLGMATALPALRSAPAIGAVASSTNVRRATELVRIGERQLAEQMLRYQARLGTPGDQEELIAVARNLDLGGAQFWLAHNGQPGTRVAAADRYPAPRWSPESGWRIDPALAFAHVIQESSFRTEAVSPAGAIGLMQVRPGTASDTARGRGDAFSPALLKRPEDNLDHGQAYIELIRGSAATHGQLPKVIAAYNAGPVPVDRWNYTNDKGDPLLWIESIPYWETRYYVPAVMRNMWVYQGLAGAPQPTLHALAEHRWPSFPVTPTRLAR